MIKFPSLCWLTCVVPSLVLVTTHIYCWSRWNFNPLLACLLYNYYCCTFIHKCWQQPAEMWNFACINFKSAMKERTAVHFQSDQYFWPCFEHEQWCKHFYGLHIKYSALHSKRSFFSEYYYIPIISPNSVRTFFSLHIIEFANSDLVQ